MNLLPPQPEPAAAVGEPWGTLTLAQHHTAFRQQITFTYLGPSNPRPDDPPRWVLHRVTQPRRRPVPPEPSSTEDWADSRSCPRLNATMRALAATPAPRFSDPTDSEAGRRTRVMLDGTDFTLDAPGRLALPDGASASARLTVETNDPGPLETWFDELTSATLTCWTSTAPAR